jgi:quercetin dioxygenase-like cupin family protein
MAPIDSRARPIAAAIPIGAHIRPTSTPATPASSQTPMRRHCSPRNREPELIRCVRLWTGSDDASHVQIGRLDMVRGRNADSVSAEMSASHMTVEETASGGSLAWRTAPVRQLVVTLGGTLIFSTRDGEQFTLRPGDVLLAEDTAGSGHRWRLEGSDPWRRMYVVLADCADVPFIAD